MEDVVPADEAAQPRDPDTAAVENIVPAGDPQLRDPVVAGRASRHSDQASEAQDKNIHANYYKKRDSEPLRKNEFLAANVTLATTRGLKLPKAVGRVAGQRAIRTLMEAFEEVRRMHTEAIMLYANAPDSRYLTEALDGLTLSLMTEAGTRAGQQILDDVRAAFGAPAIVECYEAIPGASRPDSMRRTISEEPRNCKRKRESEPLELPCKRVRRELPSYLRAG